MTVPVAALEQLIAKWRTEAHSTEITDSAQAAVHAILHKCADELSALLAVSRSYERNGIMHGERVVVVDVPRMHGTVIRCAPDGVDVRWDDGRLGQLVWDESVAYNAFRLQVLRASRSLVQETETEKD